MQFTVEDVVRRCRLQLLMRDEAGAVGGHLPARISPASESTNSAGISRAAPGTDGCII